MEAPSPETGRLVETTKRLARSLLTIGENRFELLMVELQEERERLVYAFLLALGLAAFGLLAGAAFTGAIVVLLWSVSRVAVLLILSCAYGATALLLHRRLTLLMREWQNLPATLEQLQKDRACLEKHLT